MHLIGLCLKEGGPNSTHFMSKGSLRSLHGHWAGMKSEWEHMVPTCCWQRSPLYLNEQPFEEWKQALDVDASSVPCLLKMCVSQKRVPMYPQHPARYEMRILCILCTGLRTMMILVSHILIIVRVSFVFDEESWQSTNWPWSCLSDRVMTLFWATLTSLLTGSHQRSSKSSQAWNLSRIRILSGGISPAQNLNWWDQRVFLRIKNLKAFSVSLVEAHPVESLTM